MTDGRGNAWDYTYNSWNVPQSTIEPGTAAYSSTADRTFTTAYDADGGWLVKRRVHWIIPSRSVTESPLGQ
jgi:hypothetical protein